MHDWTYEPAADLNEPLIHRLRRFPREPDMLQHAVRSVAALTIRTWLALYHRFGVEGIEHLPRDRSFVMAANHASHLDALCMLSAIPLRKLHRAFPAAAADYFFESVPRIALSVLVINALPFDRESHTRESLTVCRELLKEAGNILILFPEGTRSADGTIGTFKPGIGALLAGTDVPIVPCHLAGTHRALSKGTWLPRPRPIGLKIGHPLCFSDYATDRDSIRQLCNELRESVVGLAPDNSRTGEVRSVPARNSEAALYAPEPSRLSPA
ncbi:MAG TPA: lysophospholipid acyltransferase family protein [Tepidisphaeraceae bacterium]|nr:lysophospholipid acyltransferase family protein [Tepidisphaeraceae bacterium]